MARAVRQRGERAGKSAVARVVALAARVAEAELPGVSVERRDDRVVLTGLGLRRRAWMDPRVTGLVALVRGLWR